MNLLSEILNNNIIDKIIYIHNYYQIYTDKCILNIFSDFSVFDENGVILEKLNCIQEKAYKKGIIDIQVFINDYILMKLDNLIVIRVSLQKTHVDMPEVFNLFTHDDKIIIVE